MRLEVSNEITSDVKSIERISLNEMNEPHVNTEPIRDKRPALGALSDCDMTHRPLSVNNSKVLKLLR